MRQSKRDYEYAARRRLYAECAPIVFQISEHAENALRRIRTLVTPPQKLPDWIADDDNRLSTLYRLIAPAAAHVLLLERLTFFDVSLDPQLYLQVQLMRLAVNAFSHDISLAAAGQQKLRYIPGAEAPSGRAADPAVYHPQGIADALLDNLLGAMIDRSSSPRLLPYPSFLQANLGDGRLRAGPLLNADYLLRDFSIAERPILWRILTVQAALYAAIQIVSSGDLEILSIERLLAQEDVAGLALDEGTTDTLPSSCSAFRPAPATACIARRLEGERSWNGRSYP